jgi:O-antigen/teichoic acid export membrane protein
LVPDTRPEGEVRSREPGQGLAPATIDFSDIPASADGDAGATGGERSYGSGARVLSIGIAATGLFTFAYFGVAGHVLDAADYGRVSLLWSLLFVIMSVIYRPVEQLLSRTIADRRARGITAGHPLRTPALIQAAFAAGFLVVALALRGPIEDGLFDGHASLYWILVGAALAYAASYFARGYFAGHQWFGLYGGLVLFESLSRFCFPVAVAVGLASGETAVALGIVAAPLASLLVIPWALGRHEAASAAAAGVERDRGEIRGSAGFAGSVALIQLAEQTLLNAAVLLITDSATAGIVFSALMVARAPLQLFQAVQTSLLPHLAGLEATEGRAAFGRAIRQTILAIAGFAGLCAIGLLAIGPWVMHLAFDKEGYTHVGLAVIAVGMGLHLTAGTFNQAALARGRAHQAAAAWLAAAALFVIWMLVPVVDDQLVRAEVGYAGAAGLLCLLLYGLYRRGTASPSPR